jgi:hypothetical protein
MQPQQRRAILAAALDLQPGREPTRDTVEAAIWALAGPTADESRVGSLMDVIEAYSHARSRRAAASWAQHTGGELPPTGVDLAQTMAVRRSLERLSGTPQRRFPADNRRHYGEAQPHLTVVRAEPAAEPDLPAKKESSLEELLESIHKSVGDETPLVKKKKTPVDAADDTTLYECNSCHKEFPRSGYYNSASTPRGFAYSCRGCHSKKNKAWREKKKKRDAEAALAAIPSSEEKQEAVDSLMDLLSS